MMLKLDQPTGQVYCAKDHDWLDAEQCSGCPAFQGLDEHGWVKCTRMPRIVDLILGWTWH